MRVTQPPDLSRLRFLLSYDPSTGDFRWNVSMRGPARAGMLAGNSSGGRYVTIQIDGVAYRAHRLAWFYTHQTWPEMIDHIDGDGLNNRICNLRPASKSTNAVNSRLSKSNTSGHRGVYWSSRNGKWLAKIKVNGTDRYIGLFDNKCDAVLAYERVARSIFGEYVR